MKHPAGRFKLPLFLPDGRFRLLSIVVDDLHGHGHVIPSVGNMSHDRAETANGLLLELLKLWQQSLGLGLPGQGGASPRFEGLLNFPPHL